MRNLPAWDLRFFTKKPADTYVQSAILSASKQAVSFKKKYQGKIPTDPVKLASCLVQYEKIIVELEKPEGFAYLKFSETASDPSRGRLLQKAQALGTDARSNLIFFDLELSSTLKKHKNLVSTPKLSKYKHYLEKLLNQSKYHLTEREEKIFSDMDLTGGSAWMRLFDEEWGNQKFDFGKKKVSESEILHKLYDHNRETRKKAQASMTEGLKEQSRRILFLFNTVLADKATEDKYRGFQNPEASRHLANDTNQASVDALTDAVVSRFDVVQRFYKLKKKILKLPELYDYDRYAPVGGREPSFSWKQAEALVIESFAGLSEEFEYLAMRFFTENRVDAAHRDGKRSGAYCSFVTPDLEPVVFMNYHGSLRDVFTLAHELGHGIHACLMKDAGFLNFDVPLTVAETASVFAEMLLFERLKELLPKEALLPMYVAKIESMLATVSRQISMFRFERKFHAARASGEVPLEVVNSFWRSTQTDMFGKSVTLTPGYDYWWGYIPHFIHSPFYVYAYAFGELLTLSLYSQYMRDGERFIPKYRELLAAGGSKSPDELVKPFGAKLSEKKFWLGGMSIIEDLIKETEALAR